MKIRDFCSKALHSDEGLFKALRKLRDIETHVLADGPTEAWTPWPEMTETSEAKALA